jgi:hypothetical protein
MDLLNKAIDEIGGLDAVNRIKGITFEAPTLETPLHQKRIGLMLNSVFRSQTLTQNYNLEYSDQ